MHTHLDALLAALYQRAAAYVFPPVEDFGIMPVEALAAGAVVVANARGGAAESVTEGVDGVLFRGDDLAGLVAAVRGLLADPPPGCPAAERPERYARFSAARFRREVREWVLGPAGGHSGTETGPGGVGAPVREPASVGAGSSASTDARTPAGAGADAPTT